jgi:hypothetical protein
MKKPLAMFIAGLIAGTVVAGGVGVVSAVTNNDAPIVACADKKTGTMRYSAKGKCKKSERKLSLQAPTSLSATQIAGPKGDTGPTGPKGETGSTGAMGAKGETGPIGGGLNTVPVSFGSKTLIKTRVTGCCDYGNNNLYLRVALRNQTPDPIAFDVTASETFQIWIDYFDENGEALGCGYGCIFAPGDVTIYTSPRCSTVPSLNDISGDPLFFYEILLTNVHGEAPEAARSFAIQFRPVSMTGPESLGVELPILEFAATPTAPIELAGLTRNDVITTAC